MADNVHYNLAYPIYIISQGRGTAVVVEADGKSCIMLFTSKELAELYIEQAHAAGATGKLEVVPIADAREFERGLRGLPSTVTHALWDTTFAPGHFKLSTIQGLLDSLRNEPRRGT